MHILIVEDEKAVALQLKQLLEKEQYLCDLALDYKTALAYIDAKKFDLVLLDWNLPDGDGLSLLSLMREEDIRTPVLMLSANTTINDRVRVLDAGGDDYLCKPYSNIELLARIRALLRRELPQKSDIITVKTLRLDSKSKEVLVEDEAIKLSLSEFDLLEILLQNKNVVLTRYQLNDHLCREYSGLTQSNLVDVHIGNLRKKIQIEDFITTVRGVGYSIKA